jgi:HK97 gp10 family phage protein
MAKSTVRGLSSLLAKLGAMPPGFEDTTRLEVKRSALNVQNGARRRAPVDTGRLRNSITHETTPNGLAARVGTNVEYAPFQEFGTRRNAARPFLFPAMEQERPKFLKRLESALKKTARKGAR